MDTSAIVSETVEWYKNGIWSLVFHFMFLLFALLGAIPEDAKGRFWRAIGAFVRRFWLAILSIWLYVISLQFPSYSDLIHRGLWVLWSFWLGWKIRGWVGNEKNVLEIDTRDLQRWLNMEQVINYVRINVKGAATLDEGQICDIIVGAAASDAIVIWGQSQGSGGHKPIHSEMFKFHGWKLYRGHPFNDLRIGMGQHSDFYQLHCVADRHLVQTHWSPTAS